jgi:hypothetical protein
MSAVGSCYRAMGSEDVTVDTSVLVCAFVIMNCKAYLRAISKSSINPIMNPKSYL